MPVRDLAPALLALGEVFTEASRSLYPQQEPVALEIEATKEGSFIVDLILHGPGMAWDQINALATSDAATNIVLLKELIIGDSMNISLFGLLKWLKGRPVVERAPAEPGMIRLKTPDGASIEVPSDVATLEKSVRIRRRVHKVVEPLNRPDVDRLEFQSDEEVTVSIGEGEVSSFAVPEGFDKTLLDEEIELILEVVSPTFKDDNKWRLSDGERTFWAQIQDEEFWHGIDRGEEFGKGHRLRCRVQIVQSEQKDGRLHTDRTVIKVLSHTKPFPQLEIDEGGPPDE
ncbi:MAG: hypothetical protein ACRDPE_21205 [Solirubrobacterales bacterium]